jgi:hypothetical protein
MFIICPISTLAEVIGGKPKNKIGSKTADFSN